MYHMQMQACGGSGSMENSTGTIDAKQVQQLLNELPKLKYREYRIK